MIFCFFFCFSQRETGVEARHGGRVSIALLKLLPLVTDYGHFSQDNNSVMPKNKPKISSEALKERKMKRTREGSSQTDEDVFEDDSHGCPKCKSTNARLTEIDEKFERLLKLTDEFETYKSRVKSLEDEQKSMQESLGSSQTEIKEMQGLQDNIAEQQKSTDASLQRVQCELAELQRRHVKLECHSRRGNLKFYGIKERGMFSFILKISYIIRHCKICIAGRMHKRHILFKLEQKTRRRKNLLLNRVFHKLDNNK